MNRQVATDREARATDFMAHLGPIQDRLYRFAAHVLWDRAEVEDLLQDAALTAFEKFDQYRPGTNFRAWMFRIVVLLAANRNRALVRRRKREVSDADLSPLPSSRDCAPPPSVVADPERVLEQVGDDLRTALLALPPARRITLLLRVVEGFRYREIAEFLDIPVGTVMSHLARARAAMREHLHARGDDWTCNNGTHEAPGRIRARSSR